MQRDDRRKTGTRRQVVYDDNFFFGGRSASHSNDEAFTKRAISSVKRKRSHQNVVIVVVLPKRIVPFLMMMMMRFRRHQAVLLCLFLFLANAFAATDRPLRLANTARPRLAGQATHGQWPIYPGSLSVLFHSLKLSPALRLLFHRRICNHLKEKKERAVKWKRRIGYRSRCWPIIGEAVETCRKEREDRGDEERKRKHVGLSTGMKTEKEGRERERTLTCGSGDAVWRSR